MLVSLTNARDGSVIWSSTFDGAVEELLVLQARPITTVKEYGPAAGNRMLWDNSNIIESYSGVTSPLTFSFIRNAYATVYRCFGEVMGIPSEVQNRLSPPLATASAATIATTPMIRPTGRAHCRVRDGRAMTG